MRDATGDDDVAALVAGIIENRRGDILRAYERRVRPAGLVPAWTREQAAGVLDDLCRRVIGAEVEVHTGAPVGDAGTERADAVRGASALFDEAVRTVAAALPRDTDPRPALTALATAAHDATLARMTSATDGYAGYLLDRLHRSHVDERRRVARELHDLIAHSVAVVLQDMELFAVQRDRDPAHAEVKLTSALRNLRETLDMLREITQDLRRSAAESGLSIALRSYIESRYTATRTELEVVGDERRVPAAVRGELFLVLREALRNAHRHSNAQSVRVRVEVGAGAVRAVVSDDGRGFGPTPAHEPTTGTGLASMRERVALLGGTIDIRSIPGDGTVVLVEVPTKRGMG